jgi:pimeloyl-ACP methyl ester carboxylesterase
MRGTNLASANDNTLQLCDGRRLGYSEYGSPAGRTLFYFHGHPGSRFEAPFMADQAAQVGIRLIGIDRPGMGLSSYQAGRAILDWPDDVVELADNLKIDHFSVVGFSGGGPYVAACAYKIPDRLVTCGIVSGVGHVGPFLSFLSRWLPWLVLPITRRFFQDERRAQQSLTRFAARWPEPDRTSFLQPGVKELMAASLVEALRQGARGSAYDGMLLGSPWWGFRLEDITFPAVYLWYGERDAQIPIAPAQAIARRIPNCKATYYPDESHISVIVNHRTEIVTRLMVDSQR